MTTLPAPLRTALEAALAAEHQAVYGYPLLGARLDGAQRTLAGTCLAEHHSVRDRTAAVVSAAGLTPVAALPDYPALYPVADAAAALRVAVRLEASCCSAWRFVYARAADRSVDAGVRALRGTAQRELTAAAVRAVRWRAAVDPARATTPFPGL